MVSETSDKWAALDMFEGMRPSTEDERAAFERMLKDADGEEFCDIFEVDACDIEVDV